MNVASVPVAAATRVTNNDAPAPEWAVNRETYDAHNSIDWIRRPGWKGTLVRKEGDAPVADATVNAAHDNAKVVFDFYRDVLGRNGVDGKGGAIVSLAHSRFPMDDFGFETTPNNAAWFQGKMMYGDGDGKWFGPFAQGLDVVAHELAHGVTEKTADLVYAAQAGALNESFSDVFGELAQHWNQDKARFADPAYAKEQNWQIGESIFTPKTPGDALRDMAKPGTANERDDQPAHMRDYVHLPVDGDNDWGGVHTNSGIPNKAAYEAGVKIGGEKLAKVWYKALSEYLQPKASFYDGAAATIRAAKELYADDASVSQAVQDAWLSVGVDPANPGPVPEIPDEAVTAHSHSGDGFVPPQFRGIGSFAARAGVAQLAA